MTHATITPSSGPCSAIEAESSPGSPVSPTPPSTHTHIPVRPFIPWRRPADARRVQATARPDRRVRHRGGDPPIRLGTGVPLLASVNRWRQRSNWPRSTDCPGGRPCSAWATAGKPTSSPTTASPGTNGGPPFREHLSVLRAPWSDDESHTGERISASGRAGRTRSPFRACRRLRRRGRLRCHAARHRAARRRVDHRRNQHVELNE